MGGEGAERDLKGENLSGPGEKQDMVNLGDNGVQNDLKHSMEGAGHTGMGKGRREALSLGTAGVAEM